MVFVVDQASFLAGSGQVSPRESQRATAWCAVSIPFYVSGVILKAGNRMIAHCATSAYVQSPDFRYLLLSTGDTIFV
jgi:hypothetical protein